MPGEGPESRACGFSHRLWGRGYTCAAAKGRPRAIDIAHLGFRFEDRIPERRKTGTEGTPVGSPRNRCRAAVLYRGTEGHRYSSPRFIGLSRFEDRAAPQRRKAAHLAKGTPVGSPRESCCDGFSSTEVCDLSFAVLQATGRSRSFAFECVVHIRTAWGPFRERRARAPAPSSSTEPPSPFFWLSRGGIL